MDAIVLILLSKGVLMGISYCHYRCVTDDLNQSGLVGHNDMLRFCRILVAPAHGASARHRGEAWICVLYLFLVGLPVGH